MGIGMFRRHRYAAMRARQLAADGKDAVAGVFEAKRQALGGTPLPDTFVDARTREALQAATPVPYDTLEGLVGATEQELTRVNGIGPSTARRVIEAVEAWAAEQEPAQGEGEGGGEDEGSGDEPGEGEGGGEDPQA